MEAEPNPFLCVPNTIYLLILKRKGQMKSVINPNTSKQPNKHLLSHGGRELWLESNLIKVIFQLQFCRKTNVLGSLVRMRTREFVVKWAPTNILFKG